MESFGVGGGDTLPQVHEGSRPVLSPETGRTSSRRSPDTLRHGRQVVEDREVFLVAVVHRIRVSLNREEGADGQVDREAGHRVRPRSQRPWSSSETNEVGFP